MQSSKLTCKWMNQSNQKANTVKLDFLKGFNYILSTEEAIIKLDTLYSSKGKEKDM